MSTTEQCGWLSPGQRLQHLSSWNVWGIPFASLNVFGRPKLWRGFLEDSMLLDAAAGNHPIGKGDFVVCAFQEAWAWRVGPVYPLCTMLSWAQWLACVAQQRLQRAPAFIRRTFAALDFIILGPLGLIVQLLCLLLGWTLPWIRWDTKDFLRNESPSLSLPHAVGASGLSLYGRVLLDSGLLLLSSHRPEATGFVAFVNFEGELSWRRFPSRAFLFGLSSKLEKITNKGMLWGYWKDERCERATLVLTTHLKAGPPQHVRRAQWHELAALIEQLEERFCPSDTQALDIFVTGDFNTLPSHLFVRDFIATTGLDLLSNASDRTHIRGSTFDMIFGKTVQPANPSTHLFVGHRPTNRSTIIDGLILSDHLLVALHGLQDVPGNGDEKHAKSDHKRNSAAVGRI